MDNKDELHNHNRLFNHEWECRTTKITKLLTGILYQATSLLNLPNNNNSHLTIRNSKDPKGATLIQTSKGMKSRYHLLINKPWLTSFSNLSINQILTEEHSKILLAFKRRRK